MPATYTDVAPTTSHCHSIAVRLVNLLAEYKVEIVDEFYFMEQTQGDWLQMFRHLRRATRHLLPDPRTAPAEAAPFGDYPAYIDNQLYDAVQSLKEQSDPVDAIFAARGFLEMAHKAALSLRTVESSPKLNVNAVASGVAPQEWLSEFRPLIDAFATNVLERDLPEIRII